MSYGAILPTSSLLSCISISPIQWKHYRVIRLTQDIYRFVVVQWIWRTSVQAMFFVYLFIYFFNFKLCSSYMYFNNRSYYWYNMCAYIFQIWFAKGILHIRATLFHCLFRRIGLHLVLPVHDVLPFIPPCYNYSHKPTNSSVCFGGHCIYSWWLAFWSVFYCNHSQIWYKFFSIISWNYSCIYLSIKTVNIIKIRTARCQNCTQLW